MATKSEDIRLQMNNVKYKKGDGTLYLMAERLGWMPNTKDNFTISHKYSDVKMQKISPEGKAKIQLQIVLHTGDNTTFQFASLEDRTAVKDALLQILPQFKGKIPKDREKKGTILSNNPHLLQLYKDLVETKIVTAEDFWTQFVDDSSDPSESQSEQQDVGVSADFMAGIPINGKQVRGTVNVETLMAILKTYPLVAKKHRELVPTKMSDTEFWNKFFQSRYFSRDRTKDLFSDCSKTEEKEWNLSVKRGNLDILFDIDVIKESEHLQNESEPIPTSSHDQEKLMLKRISQQSIRLVESLERSKERAVESSQSSVTGDGSQTTDSIKTGPANTQESRQTSKTERPNLDTDFIDLAGVDNSGDYPDDQLRARMRELNKDKYTVVPRSLNHQSQAPQNVTLDHIEAIKSWDSRLTECLGAKDATEALKNLSPAGYLMRSSNTNRLADTVPEELQTQLKSAYYGSNELLRHFWLCFPDRKSVV